MRTMAAAHHTNAYRRARRTLLTRQPQPCCLCNDWIDYTLTHPHPGSPTAEHLIPASQGGDHTTLDVAHLHCQRRQGGIIATQTAWDAMPPIKTSGVW